MVEWGEVGKIASCGRKDVGKQDKHRTSQHTPINQLLFDLSTHFTMAVRLRKVFRYPEELDEREELDEEEQERVIEQLQSQNDARNAQYSVHINSYTIEFPLLSLLDGLHGSSFNGNPRLCSLGAITAQSAGTTVLFSRPNFAGDHGLYHEMLSSPARSQGQETHERPQRTYGSNSRCFGTGS